MPSSLFGRRIHIAGSISKDTDLAKDTEVAAAKALVKSLVAELVKCGANFVIPVDAEKRRSDNHPICFDWLIWESLNEAIPTRPSDAPGPLAVAVQHHKSENQIPQEYEKLWDSLRDTDHVRIENVSHWNMNSKRMETQERWGDILIVIGGDEGVLFLGNLYREAGKHVVPLNLEVCGENRGALRLFNLGLSSQDSRRLFKSQTRTAHEWINRINFTPRVPHEKRVSLVMELLENLQRPKAFAVRLLNPEHDDFPAVETYFGSVVKPFVEDKLGHDLVVVDGYQPVEEAHIDRDIFEKLHRASLVVVDITGERPNCFLEFGYALGREHPCILLAKKGTRHPFDITTYAGHHWNSEDALSKQRQDLNDHWKSVSNRPQLVVRSPLVF